MRTFDTIKLFFRFIFNLIIILSLLLNVVACTHKTDAAEADLSLALQGKDIDMERKVDELIGSFSEDLAFMGTILIAKDGKVHINKGYGKVHIGMDKFNTPKTVFPISNITMEFTAVVIMQLQEKGKLSLQDPLSKYLPDFPNADKITIHQLLSHTSGIPNEKASVWSTSKNKRYMTPESLIIRSNVKELIFEPGTDFNYSRINYYLLGYIIEKVTGMKYKDYITENVLEPLKMSSSGFEMLGSDKFTVARGHQMEYSNKKVPQAYYNEHAASSLYSTTEDLYRWDRALYTEKIISKESIQTMSRAHIENAKSAHREVINSFERRDYEKYGYGWAIENIGNHKALITRGLEAGFQTAMIRLVEEDAVIIILNNTFESPILSDDNIKELTNILFEEK